MKRELEGFIALTKALSDESRVRILMALRDGELCVCQIIELLRLAPSTVSKHLSILYQARLVESRKEGRWMHYRLPESGESSGLVRDALLWLQNHLGEQPGILEDSRRLQEIKQIPPEELCRKECSE